MAFFTSQTRPLRRETSQRRHPEVFVAVISLPLAVTDVCRCRILSRLLFEIIFFFSERRVYCIFFCVHFREVTKHTTYFMNFTEKTKDKNRTFLVSMNVTRLFTSILQNEGIEKVCRAYENFYKATHLFKHITCEKCLHLSSKKIIFQFNGKLHLQTHGTAMSTKTAVFLCQHFHGIYWNTKSKQNHL